MTKNFLRCTLILIIYCLSSCTSSDDEVGCWKCTIKKSGSEKIRTICDKTLQEASNIVLSEELGYGGSSAKNISCKPD